MANLEPEIFFSYQTEFTESGDLLRDELESILDSLNRRSRLPIALRESHRLSEGAIRLNSSLMRSIRQCLLFIGDGTSIAQIADTPPLLIPSPKVCVETGYALQSKRSEQVLLVQMERSEMPGQFPFDLPSQNRLVFKDKTQLRKLLPKAIESQLQRFNLL